MASQAKDKDEDIVRAFREKGKTCVRQFGFYLLDR